MTQGKYNHFIGYFNGKWVLGKIDEEDENTLWINIRGEYKGSPPNFRYLLDKYNENPEKSTTHLAEFLDDELRIDILINDLPEPIFTYSDKKTIRDQIDDRKLEELSDEIQEKINNGDEKLLARKKDLEKRIREFRERTKKSRPN